MLLKWSVGELKCTRARTQCRNVGLNLLATHHIPPRYLLARPKPSGASGGFENVSLVPRECRWFFLAVAFAN